MATETPVERNADLDQLHEKFLELGAQLAVLRTAIRRDNRQRMEDQVQAVGGQFQEAYKLLDSLIPGGCPNVRHQAWPE